jgi:3-methyl-2-oxobutanoate hydroxymethyltransferase
MIAGAQTVYCGYSPLIIEQLARKGTPGICHVGLVPPKASWTGGFKAIGKTLEQVQDFENAGA